MTKHIAPKKALGQNFLVDRNIANKIIAALDAGPDDDVLEIGPGEGALTDLLLQTTGCRVTAVEFDIRATEILARKFPPDAFPLFHLVQGDFLAFDLEAYASSVYQRSNCRPSIIGNIPYNITSPILFRLFECGDLLKRAIIMMQKEVAQRLVARPRSKEYGILTLATAFSARARALFDVAPSCFFPRPSVRSTVVELSFEDAGINSRASYQRVKPLVDAAFGQRRKKLSNALASYCSGRLGLSMPMVVEQAAQAGLPYMSRRAEELEAEDFRELADFLHGLD